MGSIIECIKRIYRVQTPNGVKMDVESEERSLSGAITAKLLQEDNEISSFFEKCKILGVNILHEEKISKDRVHTLEKGSLLDSAHKKSKKRLKKHKKEKKTYKKNRKEQKKAKLEISEIKIEELQEEKRLSPFERLNVLLKMEGEFTRPDYQKFMEVATQKMSDYMGHEDIEAALLLKKIEITGEKVGGFRKYKVIDTNPVDKDTYKQIIKEHKMEIKY